MYLQHAQYLFYFRMVREFAAVRNTTQIKKLITVLGREFAQSKNSHFKKGGLLGLAAMAIALGKVSNTPHLHNSIIVVSSATRRCCFVGYL